MTALSGIKSFSTSQPPVLSKPTLTPSLPLSQVRPVVTSSPADQVELRFAGRGKMLTDYYITPTHDFKQFVIDFENNYWKQDQFPWAQDVHKNLTENVAAMPPAELHRVATMALPLVDDFLKTQQAKVREKGLPLEADALRAIGSLLPPALRGGINQALELQKPLVELDDTQKRLQEKLEITQRAYADLVQEQKLNLFRRGTTVKKLETTAEKILQTAQINRLALQTDQLKQQLQQFKADAKATRRRLQAELRLEYKPLAPEVLAQMESAREIIARLLKQGLPTDATELEQVKEMVVNRQFRGLQDTTNHALAAEQTAVAPLTTGIIHYRRDREIQEAMTTFVHDEAKHSAVFRRYHAEKLNARESIAAKMVNGGEGMLWISRLMPHTAVFMAIVVETIGGAFFEYFGKNAPEPLFRQMCKTIAERDEKRHMNLCTTLYNEKYRKNSKFENFFNRQAFKGIMNALYSERTIDHYLVQASQSFGLDPADLFLHIAKRLNQEMAKIGFDAKAETLMGRFTKRKQ